jgi:hypothetical protein
LGNINVQEADSVFEVKNNADDVAIRTPGIQLKAKQHGGKPAESFCEENILIKTVP